MEPTTPTIPQELHGSKVIPIRELHQFHRSPVIKIESLTDLAYLAVTYNKPVFSIEDLAEPLIRQRSTGLTYYGIWLDGVWIEAYQKKQGAQ